MMNTHPLETLQNSETVLTSLASTYLNTMCAGTSLDDNCPTYSAGIDVRSDDVWVRSLPPDTSWYCANYSTECDPSDNEQPVSYSSFASLDILGPHLQAVPPNDAHGVSIVRTFSSNVNMTFEVSMFDFSCSNSSTMNTDDLHTLISTRGSLSPADIDQIANGTLFFMDIDSQMDSKSSEVQQMLFGSYFNLEATVWNCATRLNTRNATIACTDNPWVPLDLPYGQTVYPCNVIAIETSTLLNDTPLRNVSLATAILPMWFKADRPPLGFSSWTQQYLYSGDGLFGGKPNLPDAGWFNQSVDLSQIDLDTLSSRLTTVFNRFWGSLYEVSLGDAEYKSFLISISNTPTYFRPLPIVRCNWVFSSILTFTSFLLIGAALGSIWLRYQISTPDILGYVSSMTRNNPYTIIPGPTGSSLDGLRRTAILKDFRFRIGDVQGKEDFGEVAFALQRDGVVECIEGRKYL
jgi:hypothetical protein